MHLGMCSFGIFLIFFQKITYLESKFEEAGRTAISAKKSSKNLPKTPLNCPKIVVWGWFWVAWERLGGVLGRHGPSWAVFGRPEGVLGASWGHLWGVLGRLGVVLGSSWGVLGSSWRHLGASGGRPGGGLRASWAVL